MFKIRSVVTKNFALPLSIGYIDGDRLLCTVEGLSLMSHSLQVHVFSCIDFLKLPKLSGL